MSAFSNDKNPVQRRATLYKLIKDSIGQYDLVVSQIARSHTKNITNAESLISKIELGETIPFAKPLNVADQAKASKEIRQEMESVKKALQQDWVANGASYVRAYKAQTNDPKPESELLNKAESVHMQRGLDEAFRIAYLRAFLNQNVDWN